MEVKAEAIKLFNETWDLIDKKDRTPEEDCLMLHKAHASCYLWMQVGTQVNFERGEWQVSHVYSLLGMGVPALLHGERTLQICRDNDIGDFDLAFAYEAVARAHMLLADGKAAEFKALGVKACEAIAKQEDKDYALSCFVDIA